tara:strand:- start:4124 stop:4375 length:252 start_codon:yes stop_codon:yes gene_type:complete
MARNEPAPFSTHGGRVSDRDAERERIVNDLRTAATVMRRDFPDRPVMLAMAGALAHAAEVYARGELLCLLAPVDALDQPEDLA